MAKKTRKRILNPPFSAFASHTGKLVWEPQGSSWRGALCVYAGGKVGYMQETLVQKIGSRGEKALRENMSDDEKILVKLQGAFGQALVITDKRFYIMKWGFYAGSTFGTRCITFEYRNISSIKVTKNFATGLFEIVTAGNQDTQKSYWGNKNNTNANKADNIVVFRRNNFDAMQKAANLARDLV